LHELEEHYGFKAEVYHAKGIDTQADFEKSKKKRFFSGDKLVDVKGYDTLCKVEPFQRARKEANADCWINGRRRDHGDDRASLHCWEGAKLNPLAFWSFEDCWIYLRNNDVPYHPLHDDGFSSIGDVHSTIRVDHDEWMGYGNERKGRFVGMKDADGKTKTECGLHGGASAGALAPKAKRAKVEEQAERPTATA
jgi:phosphoadenosine phosphosulfate reductase